jgi:hypothetical protein
MSHDARSPGEIGCPKRGASAAKAGAIIGANLDAANEIARGVVQTDVMTSDDRLLLILRRLDEIERKLAHMLDELRTPTAIGYSARGGNRPRND